MCAEERSTHRDSHFLEFSLTFASRIITDVKIGVKLQITRKVLI